eukprot:s2798_g5.t2
MASAGACGAAEAHDADLGAAAAAAPAASCPHAEEPGDDEIANVLMQSFATSAPEAEMEVKEEPADEDAWTDQDWAAWEAGWWHGVKHEEDTDWYSSGDAWHDEEQPQQTHEKSADSSTHATQTHDDGFGQTTQWGFFNQKEFGDFTSYGSGKGYGYSRQYSRWTKGSSKGKYKTKAKHRKPAWAYQSWKVRQMAAGKAANKGKRDAYGGIYTDSGYRDPDGTEWECGMGRARKRSRGAGSEQKADQKRLTHSDSDQTSDRQERLLAWQAFNKLLDR